MDGWMDGWIDDRLIYSLMDCVCVMRENFI